MCAKANHPWIVAGVFCVNLVANGSHVDAAELKQKPVPTQVWTHLESSCLHCHEGGDAEGGLDLSKLSGDLSNPTVRAKWVRIHDRTKNGEMPPPDDETLDSGERKQIVSTTSRWIRWYEHQVASQFGRVRGRRLSNQQLERTLQQLFAIDTPLSRLMPLEPRTHGFHGIAEGQTMSHFHLQSHLDVVDAALDSLYDRLVSPTKPMVVQLDPKGIARKKREQRCREPELRKGLALVWSSRMPFYGKIESTTVSDSGWYRITVTASSERRPKDHGVWCTVRSGPCVSSAPLLHWIGSFEAWGKPRERVFEAYIERGHKLEIRPGDRTLKIGQFRGGQVGSGEGDSQNIPGVNLHAIKMERIYPMGSIGQVKKAVFGDLNVRIDHNRKLIQIQSKHRVRETKRQLRAFINRAFRRPISVSEAKPYTDALQANINNGLDPVDALFAAYRTVLCSPRFIYFVEQERPSAAKTEKRSRLIWLDDHSIATRLSYFLTGGPPDEALRKLADQGKLRDRDVLQEQVTRLLEGDGLRKFVKDFSGQWLDLVDIDFTEPDPRLYPDFDSVVQNAMLDETHQTLEALIKENAPVVDLIRPNFTYLNSRLARYYGINKTKKDSPTRVVLGGNSVRGGLLAHGAIVKVTANGTDTSPVLRGVWVSERILGYKIPPPPENVPAVEPDIRGAKTIRDQLEKHTSNASCAACHRTIDPPGYALENFDPAGKWRDRYVTNGSKKRQKQPVIDASFEMPDGQKFQNFNQFRDLICQEPDRLAANFVSQLLTYATGAPVRFSDRGDIAKIVQHTSKQKHGLRSMINAIVTSPTFVSK